MSFFGFLKKHFYLFALLTVVACNNSDCIEGDDFGEYDTDIVEVLSKSGACYWGAYSDENNGPWMMQCLNGEIDGIGIIEPQEDGNCKPTRSAKEITCLNYASCVDDGANSLDCFKGLLNNLSECRDDQLSSMLNNVYSKCQDLCYEKCQNTVGFDPGWIGNTLKSESSILGIVLENGKEVEVQARGSVQLLQSEQEDISGKNGGREFLPLTDQLIENGFFFSIKGKTGTPNASNVGETNNQEENLTARNEFLSRLFFFVRQLPSGLSVGSNGNLGEIEKSLFYDKEFYNKFIWDNDTLSYDFSSMPGISDTNAAIIRKMYIQNEFYRQYGGLLIPESLEKYVFDYPFSEQRIVCSDSEITGSIQCLLFNMTELPDGNFLNCDKSGSNNIYMCSVGGLAKYEPTKTPDDISPNGDVPFFISAFEAKEGIALINGIITGNSGNREDGSFEINGVSVLFPVKIAVKTMIPGNIIDQENQVCRISFYHNKKSGESADLIEENIKISPRIDNSWKYLPGKSAANEFILGNYKPLKEFSDSDENLNYVEFVENYTIVLSKECKHVGLFLIPQPEIEIKTSGFIDMKNFNVTDFNGTVATIDMDIINPMRNVEDETIFMQNFYENIVNNNYKYKTISVGNNWNTNEGLNLFVRRGQILRLSSSNWFDLSSNNVIKPPFNNGVFAKNYIAMRISERPAIYCSDREMIRFKLNPSCDLTDNSNYSDYYTYTSEELEALKSKSDYSTLCKIDTSTLCPSNEGVGDSYDKSRICPLGCYPGETETCPANGLDSEYFGTAATCKKCKEFFGNQRPEAVIEEPYKACYSMENYKGAFRNRNENFAVDSGDYADNDYIKNLGTIELVKNIFENTLQGNLLGGVELETSSENALCSSVGSSTKQKCSEYWYKSNFEFPISGFSEIDYLFINNNNFEFENDNKGEFIIRRNKDKLFRNGQMLSAVLAHKNWNGRVNQNDNDSAIWDGMSAAPTGVCAQLVMYDNNVFPNPPTLRFPTVGSEELYGFNASGYMSRLIGNNFQNNVSDKYMVKKTEANCSYQNKEIPYEDLKFFFKIIDITECSNVKFSEGATFNEVSYCRFKELDSDRYYEPYDEFDCSEEKEDRCYKIVNSKGQVEGADCDSNNRCKEPSDGKPADCLFYIPSVSRIEKTCNVSKFSNNSGSYSVRLKTKRSTKLSGYIVDYIMKPILEVFDGKTIAIEKNLNGTSIPQDLVPCTAEKNIINTITNSFVANPRCVWYDPNDLSNTQFGMGCSMGDENCYSSCFNSESGVEFFRNKCYIVNNGEGFLQKFYVAIISSPEYQNILRLCFVLMITFYGMYYLMGLSDLTHSELIKRVFKISFIYLMVGTRGWEFYNAFFVRFFKSGVDYLVFATAGSFDTVDTINAAFAKANFYDKSVLFGGVDRNLVLLFSDQVSYKIWGLFFVSFFGWLYVFLIYYSILTYIFAIANSLLLYLTAQFFITFLLAFGPIFFILLIFDKTKGMFDKWITNLVGFSLEQVFLLTVLGIFNMLMYNIIKYVLSYRVCWVPVWNIDIPVIGRFQLMSFWKATSSTDPEAAAAALPGLFQILMIYLIADLMKNFIKTAADIGSSLGGATLTSSLMSGDIAKTGQDLYKQKIEQPIKAKAQDLGTKFASKTIGYRTDAQVAQEKKDNKDVRDGIRSAKNAANAAVAEQRKKDLLDPKFMALSKEEQNAKYAALAREKMEASIRNNGAMQGAMQRLGYSEDDVMTKNVGRFQAGPESGIGLAANVAKGIGAGMFLNRFKSAESTEKKFANRSHTSETGAIAGFKDGGIGGAVEGFKEKRSIIKSNSEKLKSRRNELNKIKKKEEDKNAFDQSAEGKELAELNEARGNFARRAVGTVSPLGNVTPLASGYQKLAKKELQSSTDRENFKGPRSVKDLSTKENISFKDPNDPSKEIKKSERQIYDEAGLEAGKKFDREHGGDGKKQGFISRVFDSKENVIAKADRLRERDDVVKSAQAEAMEKIRGFREKNTPDDEEKPTVNIEPKP